MKFLHYPLAVAFFVTGIVKGQDIRGIKSQNLKGADIALMNNHDPVSELDNFELLAGYQVNLFATDPMLANPVHMNWDSKGRLWVACSWSYPQIKPGEIANDKIIILEDTDNDGAADKSTIFADGLYLPTGIELANGGCYVGQSPDVFFLKDTNGDNVADIKELALTGFGIEDSHHSISAWRRGPGGWIYFQEGIFLHSQIETQYGVLRNFNGGVYQYNPRTQEIRLFCRGTGGNPWGHVFDRWGQSFMVNNPRIMYLSPATGNSGESVPVGAIITTSKQCGGDLATGSHIGDDLRGQLLTGRFKERTVVRYEFIEKGAGFSANVLEPLISSKHPNFRPVDVKTGPDGAIYIADWYNSIINHAQHDFRDPRRDNEHGRIWRITRKGSPLVKKPKLDGISIADLVGHLKSQETWTRHQARKELSERDPDDVLEAVEDWVMKLNPDLADYDHHLVEAMWACQNVERVSEVIFTRVMAAKDGHARSAAARTLRYWHQDLSDPIAYVATLAGDAFPRTRMEAVLSAGFIPSANAYTAALNVLDLPADKEIDKALSQTTKALASFYLPAMENGELKFSQPSHKTFVENGAGIGFIDRLNGLIKNPAPKQKEIIAIKEHLINRGSSEEIAALVNGLSGRNPVKSIEVTSALLEALMSKAGSESSRAVRRRLPRLVQLLDHENENIVKLTAKTLGAWRVPQAVPYLINILEEEDSSRALRQAAAVGLAGVGGQENLKQLSDLTRVGHEVEIRYAALLGLLSLDLVKGIDAMTDLYSVDPEDADPLPALRTVLKNREGAEMLSVKLKTVKLHPNVAKKVNQFHRSSGMLPEELIPFFNHSPDTNLTLTERLLAENQESLTADVVKLGDPHRGEMIYRRPSIACIACHAVGSAGATIGPNLVGVGAAASPFYMVESILKPNAAIAEHYENRLFTFKDDTVQMGVVTFRSEKMVVVRDSVQAGKQITISAETIQSEEALPSLMPTGLADMLNNRQEFLDLSKFLSVLGRPGDFANDESPVIRKWGVIAGSDAPPSEAAAWIPAYSKVDGTLPSEDLEDGESVFARGYVNVQVSGKVDLKINTTEGLKLWLDDQVITDLDAELDLKAGRRLLTFQIDRNTRPTHIGLRVEFETPLGSTLKLQPEGGM
ncbi:HEAT repeat domain-containing protein [bacterium]|nr:HEAT repeat domain-containing protein [bacterium]